MKVILIFLALFIFSGCTVDTSASKDERLPTSPTPPQDNSNDVNLNAIRQPFYEGEKIDKVRRSELEANNEKFKVVPDEFKNVDFRNFKYPIARLKNGEHDSRNPKNPLAGGQSITFDDVYYLDIDGDGKKEAIVFLYIVGCGASCDGGASQIYFYSSKNGETKLLDSIEFGSRADGCSLKSFRIANKKIYIEQFGRCVKSNYEEDRNYTCKFCVKDLTKTVYFFKNSQLAKESSEIVDTPETNVMNYSSEISISK